MIEVIYSKMFSCLNVKEIPENKCNYNFLLRLDSYAYYCIQFIYRLIVVLMRY